MPLVMLQCYLGNSVSQHTHYDTKQLCWMHNLMSPTNSVEK